MIGLLSLTADAVLSSGYLLYKFTSATVKWSIFDTCSSVGAIACLVGIFAAAAIGCVLIGWGIRDRANRVMLVGLMALVPLIATVVVRLVRGPFG